MAKVRSQHPDNGSHYASEKPPQFFKIMLSSEPRLRLPRKFVKKYGHGLPYVVSLEAPRGPIFQVELARRNGEIWFEKGFQDFRNYYSIGFGYFLVFTYNQDFYFQVAIFDTSATEIEYPYTAIKPRHRNKFEKSAPIKEERQSECKSDDCVEILARIPTWQKCKGSDRNTAKFVHKEVSSKVRDCCLTKRNAKRKRCAEDGDVSIKMKKECSARSGSHLQHPISGSAQTIKVKDNFLAYQKAKAFKSRNPSFISFMQPSYVSGTSVLWISRIFAQTYLGCQKNNDVVLCGSRGRKWNVTCYVGSGNAKLYWKKFVEDNGLQVGDACVFECPKNTKYPVLNVSIFRTIEVAEDCQRNSVKEVKVLGGYPTKQKGMRKRPKVEDTALY